MGVGRFVLLEPNVRSVVVEVEPPSLEDARSHSRRLLDALDAEGYEPLVAPSVLPRLALAMRDEPTHLVATLVGPHLVDVVAGDVAPPAFGISLDIGTTTVVASLVDLATGAVAAVESTINRQAPYGADVIARMGHAMTGDEAIADLRDAVLATVNGLVESVCATAGTDRNRVLEIVAVGNATMLHLLLGDRSPLDRAVAVRRDVPRAAGPPRARRRRRGPLRGPSRAPAVGRRLRRRGHRRRRRRERARARAARSASSSTSARTARSSAAPSTRRRDGGARGSGVRGRPDPPRHARDRGRHRGRRPRRTTACASR